jgi:calcineurin-like phosphoesterase family protein
VTIFFTSDTHFGDHRTLNIWKRPFASVAEMDALLLERWNKTVAPDDEVWHLGDFCRRPADAPALLARLHGTKHLVAGNNDAPGTRQAPGWASVQDYAELETDGRRLILCHYAFRTWRDQHKGAVNLHGHSHGRLKPLPRQQDVGVDVWNWRPVTLEEIVAGPKRSA